MVVTEGLPRAPETASRGQAIPSEPSAGATSIRYLWGSQMDMSVRFTCACVGLDLYAVLTRGILLPEDDTKMRRRRDRIIDRPPMTVNRLVHGCRFPSLAGKYTSSLR